MCLDFVFIASVLRQGLLFGVFLFKCLFFETFIVWILFSLLFAFKKKIIFVVVVLLLLSLGSAGESHRDIIFNNNNVHLVSWPSVLAFSFTHIFILTTKN